MKILLTILSILFVTQAFAADPKILYTAASRGDYDAVQRWITVGGDIKSQDKYGNSALLLASENGHADVVQLLVEHGAPLDQMNVQGYTPMYSAVTNAHPYVINILYAGGAKTNVKNQYRSTAIDFIRSQGFNDVTSYVKNLLTKDPSLKTGPNSYLYMKAWEKRRLAQIEKGEDSEALKTMVEAAKIDPDAQYYLALQLLKEGNSDEGMKYMERAADGGVVDAQYRMGVYLTDELNPIHPSRGFKYMQMAANAEHPEAIAELGRLYLFGIGTKLDVDKAREFIDRAVDYGIADALYYQGIMQYYGMGVPEDKVRGLEKLQALAKNGHIKAKRQVSRIFTEETLDYLAYIEDLTEPEVHTFMLSQGVVQTADANNCNVYDVSKAFDPDYGITAISTCFYENKPGSLVFDVKSEMEPLYREWLINYQMRVPVRYDLK
ncbi:MAG: ankyrin repeat domain-containing protein [Deferribacteraceae bacterium]|jgi:TPR repeat protein|nr:ankyrin repeat domain-containing protein [Deferribacteraceae bacterium]